MVRYCIDAWEIMNLFPRQIVMIWCSRLCGFGGVEKMKDCAVGNMFCSPEKFWCHGPHHVLFCQWVNFWREEEEGYLWSETAYCLKCENIFGNIELKVWDDVAWCDVTWRCVPKPDDVMIWRVCDMFCHMGTWHHNVTNVIQLATTGCKILSEPCQGIQSAILLSALMSSLMPKLWLSSEAWTTIQTTTVGSALYLKYVPLVHEKGADWQYKYSHFLSVFNQHRKYMLWTWKLYSSFDMIIVTQAARARAKRRVTIFSWWLITAHIVGSSEHPINWLPGGWWWSWRLCCLEMFAWLMDLIGLCATSAQRWWKLHPLSTGLDAAYWCCCLSSQSWWLMISPQNICSLSTQSFNLLAVSDSWTLKTWVLRSPWMIVCYIPP